MENLLPFVFTDTVFDAVNTVMSVSVLWQRKIKVFLAKERKKERDKKLFHRNRRNK